MFEERLRVQKLARVLLGFLAGPLPSFSKEKLPSGRKINLDAVKSFSFLFVDNAHNIERFLEAFFGIKLLMHCQSLLVHICTRTVFQTDEMKCTKKKK